MAASYRSPDSSIADILQKDPCRFDFFQAVRLLEINRRKIDFTATTSLSFPASEIISLTEDEERFTLHVSFLSLTGAHGPMPFWLSELLAERIKLGDTVLRDFLDLFNNRLIHLFYRGVQSVSPGHLLTDNPQNSSFSEYFYTFSGIAFKIREAINDRSRLNFATLLRHAGLYNTNPKSAAGLRRIISDLFKVDVEIISFRGAWLHLEPTDYTRIGNSKGINNSLGKDTILGTQFWDQAAGFTLRLKNLSYKEYLSFLPEPPGRLRQLLLELIHLYVGSGITCYLELELRPEERPPIHVGKSGNGWLGWI